MNQMVGSIRGVSDDGEVVCGGSNDSKRVILDFEEDCFVRSRDGVPQFSEETFNFGVPVMGTLF